MDYIAGNLGLNTQYKASYSEPVRVYAADFDNNGSMDPIVTYYKKGKEYAVPIRDVMHEQIPSILRKRFVSYTDYANADISNVLHEEDKAGAEILAAYEMRSSYIENLGNGEFKIKPLQVSAQFSPVFGLAIEDFNGDGLLDVLTAGNSHASETYAGWYDASFGTILTGDGKSNLSAMDQANSGIYLNNDAKAMSEVFTKNRKLILISNNNGPLEILQCNKIGRSFVKAGKMDAWALVKKANGKIQKVEFTYGQGYLSQSSRILELNTGVRLMSIYDFSGKAHEP
jgi:hypothetical protein